MLSYQNFILRRTLPLASFNGLRTAFGQMAQRVGAGCLLLTEDVLSSLEIRPHQQETKFVLLVSDQFSALLLGTQQPNEINWKDLENKPYDIGLTFEPQAIAEFLTQLSSLLENNSFAVETLQEAKQILQPNNPHLQSEFTLSLLEIITAQSYKNHIIETNYPFVSVCQPVHNALRQQVEQERLLNQVTTQIRQSLELPVILKTAVEQVRNFFQADRLVIYQFDQASFDVDTLATETFNVEPDNGKDAVHLRSDLRSGEVEPPGVRDQVEPGHEKPGVRDQVEPGHEKKISQFPGIYNQVKTGEVEPPGVKKLNKNDRFIWGRVTYESRASEQIISVLDFSEEERCFFQVPNCREKYRKGFILTVKDIEAAYIFYPCLLDLMRRTQVKAKLVVPILIKEKLWGLLIAHQCLETRQWQDNEKRFLSDIAEHLAIAIYQAQLYAAVQQQKETLEQRVIDRTQELHDAMLLAQSANRAKSEFLATMSHELRTPLTCVIGLSSTLLRWSFGQLSQKQRDYLQSIHDNGEHLLELINDILELSQLESGKMVLKVTEFSLSQIVQQELTNLKQKAAQRGVELAIATRLDSQQDDFLGDERKVRQIIYNLLTNGIKFTPTGGRVILRVWREGTRAVIQVEDTGIGIPENQKHLLFQKFQQLDSSYHRQYEGTGLGLALTKQLVELHGGRIEVNSIVDVGSIFTVWLSQQQYSSPQLKSQSNQSQLGYKKEEAPINLDFPAGRILVIENHEETATLICEILTAAGFQVVWLLEGSTALTQIEILQPLIVIVDFQISGINLQEIINQIRQLPGMENQKILALIAKHQLENYLPSLSAGVNDYLTKPILPQSLLQKIQTLMADRESPKNDK